MADASFILFSGTSHPSLAGEIADRLGVRLGDVLIDVFPDGEIGIQIMENVRGRDVFVMQSIARNPNLYLMELLIFVDALKRVPARHITAVIPYYGYARQDRIDKEGVPITAKMVADLLERVGTHRVITMDLHAEQIQGFFNVPVDNLYSSSALVKGVRRVGCEGAVIMAPDVGNVKFIRLMATEMGASFAVVDKRRIDPSHVGARRLIGEMRGRDVILVDDICSSGATLHSAALACVEGGAKRIFAAVTHGLFMDKEIFNNRAIERFLVANTVPLPDGIDCSRIEVCSVAGTFGRAIECVSNHESMDSLFRPTT